MDARRADVCTEDVARKQRWPPSHNIIGDDLRLDLRLSHFFLARLDYGKLSLNLHERRFSKLLLYQ
jgi:hypothetical protein